MGWWFFWCDVEFMWEIGDDVKYNGNWLCMYVMGGDLGDVCWFELVYWLIVD